uniref:Uncharacterized protein n=1 Tax=uncultured marine group II/III euryarchaeote AD1000_16_A02 TaxID=1457730 RepID=A0A075FJV1_9EURY|nr:hypothetical protein [uncultured marine group II/III euryarchaeote AD1000_16_A02]
MIESSIETGANVYELCSNCIKRQEIWLVYGFKYAYARSIKILRGFKAPKQDENEGFISSLADDINFISGVGICCLGSVCINRPRWGWINLWYGILTTDSMSRLGF